MQGYSTGFARIYNQRWIPFANQFAPVLQMYYENTILGAKNRDMLDLCCGTGQLALYFMEKGYRVTGLDLSPAMLELARENAAHVPGGEKIRWIQGDASQFEINDQFGLVVSTYDALNHLPGMDALRSCFHCVSRVLLPGGVFIFDLNTRNGLRRWNGITVEDNEEIMMVNRGFFDEERSLAQTRYSGFWRNPEGVYERFEENVFETAFVLDEVRAALLQAGWHTVHFSRMADPTVPLAEPEAERRVLIVAVK